MNEPTTITEKERALLTAIRDDEFQDGQCPVGNPVWSFSPCGQFGTSAGGIMASLVKKGLAGADDHGYSDPVCWVTQEGCDAIEKESN